MKYPILPTLIAFCICSTLVAQSLPTDTAAQRSFQWQGEVPPLPQIAPVAVAAVPTGVPSPAVPPAVQPTFVPPQALPTVTPTPPPLAQPPVARSRTLTAISVQELESRLLERLGQRFVPVRQIVTEGDRAVYRLPVRNGSVVDLELDRNSHTVVVRGTVAAADAVVRLVELMDVPSDANKRTEIVPFQREAYRAVAQVADVIENESRDTTTQPRRNATISERRTPREQTTVANNTAVATAIRRATAEGLIGPVEIEMLDGLDTIVLRGNKNDVQIVLDMVRQIETMNIDTEPEITIYRMRETDCTRVAQIVVRLYNEVYVSRRGSVTFLALLKPNAILLVGQKGAVQTAIDLIRKLDKPVSPEADFLVVRLKNAVAATVKTQIDEFFADRGVLSTQVSATSDARSNSLILQGSARDLAEVAEFIRSLDVPRGDAVNQARIIQLKNAVASDLATTINNAISGTSGTNQSTTRNAVLEITTLDRQSGDAIISGVLSEARVTADTRSNSLIVSAPAETLPLIETLIMQLDRLPNAESQVKIFTIVNGDASSLVTMLQTIFQSSTTTGGTGNQTSNIATVRAGTASDESTLVGVRFAVENRTNSIIASGSASDMSLVEAILFRLDEENVQNRQVVMFRLLNSPAEDVASAINAYLTSERQLELQSSGTFYPQSPLEQYRKEVVVVADPISNNLIVSTTPRYYEAIKKIVARLDERPYQVVIQVMLAQVSLTNGRDFGVELGLQDSILFNRSVGGIPGFNFLNSNPLGNNTNTAHPDWVGTQGVTSLGVGRANSAGNSGFVFSASSESLAILVRALEEQKKVQVLSRPQMATTDNKKATVTSGETVRMVTQVSQTNTGTTAGTEEVEAGLILDVTPRITPDGMVVMDIYAERSRFGPEAEGTVVGISGTREFRAPRKEVVKSQTTIGAMSGQTIIIGGIITDDKSTVTRGVPFLNKIPVVKSLFEYKSVSHSKSELIIIMTPIIIRNECDMEVLKQQELARIHWCISDVIRAGGESAWRQRTDDWTPTDTQVVWMSDPIKPDEKDLPSIEKVKTKLPIPAVPR
ncbi:MAG: secretin N-terminal domain-containing protein [Thermoguttaceae bacterium]